MNLWLVALSALLMLPALFWLFRFWFGSWREFVEETDCREDDGFWWRLIRWEVFGEWAVGKLALLVLLPYAILVFLAARSLLLWLA